LTITYDAAKNVLILLQEAIKAADLYGWDTFNPLLLPSSELKCFSYENNPVTWLDETAAANEDTADDMNLPLKNATSPQNDAYYWGNKDSKFDRITINITRAGVGNWSPSNMVFEYSTATGWASCNPYTTDTSNRFKNAGIQTITFDLAAFASNWAKRAVGPAGNQITAYWIRVRFTSTLATVTTAPKAGQCWLSISHKYWFTGAAATPRSAFQPLDWNDMKFSIIFSAFTLPGTINIKGTDRDGNPLTETFNVDAPPLGFWRYFRSDIVTVNGLTCYSWGTSNTASSAYGQEQRTGIGNNGATFGIRIWKRDSLGNETEITGGSPEAQIGITDTEGIQKVEWKFPGVTLAATDSLVIRVYCDIGAGFAQVGEFTSEQLGLTSLSADYWNFELYLYHSYDSGSDTTTGRFYFGDETYQSRVCTMYKRITSHYYKAIDAPDGIKVTGRFDYQLSFPRQGLIGKGSANQYYFLCQFVLGDGTEGNASSWVDGDQYPTPGAMLYHFTADSLGSNSYQIWVKPYSSLQFGACPDETYKVTEGGVTIVNDAAYPIYGDVNSDVRLYNTHFYSSGVSTLQLKGTVQRVWNCVLRETYLLVTNGDVYRLSCYSGYPLYQQVSGTFQDIAAIGCFTLALFQTTGTMNIQNFYVRDLIRQNPNQTICVLQAGNRTINLDDGDSDAWNMEASPAQTSTINRRYSFDVTVKDGKTKTPIQNATVILYDKDGNQIFSLATDANGHITTQKVVHSDWRYVNSEGLKTSPDNTYSPFKLVVKANGYQTYSNPNITLDKPTRVEVGLVKAVDIIFVDGKLALNLDETDPENEVYKML